MNTELALAHRGRGADRSGRPGSATRARARVVLGVAVLGAALAGGWPALLAVTAAGPVSVAALVAHVAGMLAGYGVLLLVMLMSRWPVLERGVGADRLARWHVLGGRVILTLIVVHAGAAVQGWADAQRLPLGTALLQVLGMPGLVSASVATVGLVLIGTTSVAAARRRMSYERWKSIHLLTYLAIALSFLHQLAGPDLAGHPVVQVAWALLYTHTFALVLRHRVLAPLRRAVRHRLRVEDVVEEAPGVVSIVLSGRHLEEMRAEPGQFFRWRFLTPDTWLTAHPFSLSAPATGDRLRLTVKALGDGSRLLQSVDPGTWVVAEGPYGAMTAARRTRRGVALVAGGVGITPMRALFETLPKAGDQDLVLLYRANTREDIVFRAELDALAAERRARVIYLLGDNPDLLTAASLTRLVSDLAARDVYLCGPPGMTATVRRSLRQAGLPARRLHEERFAL